MDGWKEYFTSQVNNIISRAGDNTLVVFRGFSAEENQAIIGHSKSILNDSSLYEEGNLNLTYLDNTSLELAAEMSRMNGVRIGIYEELLSVRPFLDKIRLSTILIIENNFLSPWVPCYIPYDNVLELFDYLQSDKEISPDNINILTNYYADVKFLDNGRALLLPISIEDSRIKTQPFWKEVYQGKNNWPDVERIECGSVKYWCYLLDATAGHYSPALFLEGDVADNRLGAIQYAASQFGIEVYVDKQRNYRNKAVYDETPYIEILKRHWGETAEFRPLLFYKNPDLSQETETISQGQIIAEIASQCEAAFDKRRYSNVFITAPTGSGKSILFQIPALYLKEKYDLITVIVSPLIALMNDQVNQLQTQRGVSSAVCINSSMSLDERAKVIERIQNGKIALLYLAPELLLTTNLKTFLAGHQIGMMVIDEAHTVTSWGRDFRSDYWFLGDFLKKCARNGMSFPVVCLTATAVYSGNDDVVNDTINELGLEDTIIHLGNVKRNNIEFDIQLRSPNEATKIEEEKILLTTNRVKEYVKNHEKVLAYFPYRRHVDLAYDRLSVKDHHSIRRYHSKVPPEERKLVERDYKGGTAIGLFCTKAFGMGVDVSDIKHVVHFAPTGTLADYVQEVGRAARNQKIHGVAHIDYFKGDTRYVRALNGMSEMRQFQLREMLRKISAIYKLKKRRGLLISSETFDYLFHGNDAEERTKSGLMLLSKDLANKYTFPVLIVRPKTMLSQNYVFVPHEIEGNILAQYKDYLKLQYGSSHRTTDVGGWSMNSSIKSYSPGNIYLADMKKIWEDFFPELTFGMFKNKFFEQKFSAGKDTYRVAPRVRVEIQYNDEYSEIMNKFETAISAIVEVLRKYKNSDVKQFTANQFESDLYEALTEKIISHDKIGLLLDVFTEAVDENAIYSTSRSQLRVIRKRKGTRPDENYYYVSSAAYAGLARFTTNKLRQCAPQKDGRYVQFYPIIKDKQIEIMPILRILELLGLATYEIRGGEKSEVFIRINDPLKLERIANSGNYTNNVLKAIQERHRRSEKLIEAFFLANMNTEERWELIEQYFIGNEDYVNKALKLEAANP